MSRLNTTKYWVAGLTVLASALLLLHIYLPTLEAIPSAFEKAQQATAIVKSPSGTGSGAIIKRNNPNWNSRLFVWTAAHVVNDANEFVIEQKIRNEFRKVGSVTFTAHVIMRDEKVDIALLWLDAPASYFGSVEFEDVQRQIGDPVFHVGNFLGELDDSVSWGRISQFGIGGGKLWASVDQADMVILPGSSGGPLFSSDSNKMLGIVVGWPRVSGVNFYVPLRTIRWVARENGIEWAIDGHFCPDDKALDKLVKKCKLEIKDEPVPAIKAPDESVEPKKPLRRFTFRGW